MWLQRGLSTNGASIYLCIGYDQGMHSQETRGSGSGCDGKFPDMSATQRSNVSHRATVAETQLLEHFGGSGLDRENRQLWRVSRVCELYLSSVVVERLC